MRSLRSRRGETPRERSAPSQAAFFSCGFLIVRATNGLTAGGFRLDGAPALLLFAAIVAYFVVGKRVGGTLRKRVLGAVR
jgi:hypothetical protein